MKLEIFLQYFFLIAISATSIYKYILYNVKNVEGFNLRRDVFIRITQSIIEWNKNFPDKKISIVLPPFHHISHWNKQKNVSWWNFFDKTSMTTITPIYDFLEDYYPLFKSRIIVDLVVKLQEFEEGIDYQNFIEKIEERKCLHKSITYHQLRNGEWRAVGSTKLLWNFFNNSNYQTIMIENLEQLLHIEFGDKFYWDIRNKMVFSSPLQQIGERFLKNENLIENFNLFDKLKENRLTCQKDLNRITPPTNYMAIHLRRRDFGNRRATIPQIKRTINHLMNKKNLSITNIFVATDDATGKFKEILRKELNGKKLIFSTNKLDGDDGDLSIIDQIICSYSLLFIGTDSSTFSYRILEERELMLLDSHLTFNKFCQNFETKNCNEFTRWLYVP
ncbi:hypothetical protein SNEBB_010581 [Seison nebaliae]|nr:hypothetical protein SNEBB_010581 [Seison nebaliae]